MKRQHQNSKRMILFLMFVALFAGSGILSYSQRMDETDKSPLVKDSVSFFKCKCGDKYTDTRVSSLPIVIEGRVVWKTYFNHIEKVYADSAFSRKFYDYLYLKGDTIFVVGGQNDTLSSGFLDKRQVLCILRKIRRSYDLPEQVNFFRPLTFRNSYFDKKEGEHIYSYLTGTEGHAADLPYFTRMDFSESGKVVYYEFNSGYDNYLWECRKVYIADN